MTYRFALPLLALVAAGGCGGGDPIAPNERVALVASAAPGASGNSNTPRSEEVHITKNCQDYTRLAGGYCTITSSNLKEIPVGTRVVYKLASGATVLDTDVILDPPGPSASTALGHVVLDLVGRHGQASFSGGTGRFKRFSADVEISWLGGRDWAWDGSIAYTGDASGD